MLQAEVLLLSHNPDPVCLYFFKRCTYLKDTDKHTERELKMAEKGSGGEISDLVLLAHSPNGCSSQIRARSQKPHPGLPWTHETEASLTAFAVEFVGR